MEPTQLDAECGASCKMGFGQKEALPTFHILSNCLWTTSFSTSSNPKSFFASLMKGFVILKIRL